MKVSSKKLLTLGIIGTAFLSSCHTANPNQSQSGNGTASTSGYTLSAQALVNPPVYSVQTSGSTYAIPTDTWYLTVDLSYSNPLSNSSSSTSLSSTQVQGATLQSASICFDDPTIPGGECQTISLSSNSISASTPLQTSFTLPNVYKLGAIALSANPFQNQPSGVSLTVPLIAESTTSLAYAPVLMIVSNLVPSSLNIGYTGAYANGNIQMSVTSVTNIYNSGTLVSSSSSVSSTNYSSSTPYSFSGFCVDNGNGSFSNTLCSGSINYTQGVVSSFSLLIPSTTTISTTISTAYSLTNSTTTSSTTASSSTQIISITSDTSTYYNPTISQTLSANYVSYSGQVSGSVFSAVVNMPISSSSGQSYSTYYIPGYVVVGSNTILCSPSICSLQQLSPGVYSLNINLANSLSSISAVSTGAYAVIKQYITFNPSVYITQAQPVANLPYTLYLDVLLPNGQTLSTSYSNQMVIQNPY